MLCTTGRMNAREPVNCNAACREMLFQTLKELEQRGLIARHVYDVIPPKVDYRLTPLGKTFAEPIEQMYQWGLENQSALDKMEACYQAAISD